MGYEIAPYRVGDMIGEAWRLVQENFAILVGIHSVAIVLGLITDQLAPGSLWSLVIGFALAPISLGVTVKVLLDNLRDEMPTIDSAFDFAGPRYLKIFMINVLYTVAVLIGLCLLIVPGIYIAIRFWFATIVAMLEPVGIMQSFGRSGDIADGNFGRLIGLNILAGILWAAIILILPVMSTTIAAWTGQAGAIMWLTEAATRLITVLPSAFMSALVVVAYFGLRARNEDIDNSILAELPG